MSKEQEAIEELKEMDSYAYQEEAEAIAEAIRALEVVEKIKQSFVENNHGDYDWSRDFGEAVYEILCKAYGSDTDCESWVNEYKELQAMLKAFKDLDRGVE